MIKYAYKFNNIIKMGIMNYDNQENLMYNISKGAKF